MNKFLMLLAAATLVASNVGCGCCRNLFSPPAPTMCAAPMPVCAPVAADPCGVPTTTCCPPCGGM